ncbi:MAG: glycosyltransferase [Actinomyces sp.]|nr:MAG: glycosyltransferase [Actinomyces sp.]
MTRPRVAVYHDLPPGGALRSLWELVTRSRNELEHVVFTVDRGDTAEGEPAGADDVEVHRLPLPPGSESPVGTWAREVPRLLAAERRLARRLDAAGFDAVVTHPSRRTQAPHLLSVLTTPSVYFAQEPRRQSFEYELRPWRRHRGVRRVAAAVVDTAIAGIDRTAARAATALICNSEHTREYLWRAYGREATVVPLGVDTDRFRPDPGTVRRHEVLAVAAIERPKGLDLAVDALALLPPDLRPRLRVVHNRADPRHRRELAERAADRGVEIVYDHAVDDETLVERYRHARLCLLTARVEPLGLTALEALACGTPVVAVREGGYRETVVDGVTGLLTDRRPEAVARALTTVLTRSFAPEPAFLHRQVARTRGWDTAVERYVEAVTAVIGTAGARSAAALHPQVTK